MSDRSKIEWTDASWNPLRAGVDLASDGEVWHRVGWHCEHVSEGCRNCYAESINRRLGTTLDYKPGHRERIDCFLDEKALLAPLHWRKPRKIFVGSMTDLFGDWVDEEMLLKVFGVMAHTPQHTYQVLTKRPKRAQEFISQWAAQADSIEPRTGGYTMVDWPLPNVWLGVSCEDQATANERIPLLRDTPAAIRFLSLEPLLGPIGISQSAGAWWQAPAIHWVIVGGESGPGARPMHPEWARAIREQCTDVPVAFFFKQRGEYTWIDDGDYDTDNIPELPQNWRQRTDDKFICMRADGSRASGYGGDSAEFFFRVGKKRAGRLLDGVEHNGFPA